VCVCCQWVKKLLITSEA